MPYAEIYLHIIDQVTLLRTVQCSTNSVHSGDLEHKKAPADIFQPDDVQCLARIRWWHASGYQPSSGEHFCTRVGVAKLQGIKPGAVPCSQKVILDNHVMFANVLRALKCRRSSRRVTNGLCVGSIPEHRDEWYNVHAEFGLAGNVTMASEMLCYLSEMIQCRYTGV